MKTDGSEEKNATMYCPPILQWKCSAIPVDNTGEIDATQDYRVPSHAISTINECLSVRQDADEVGGQTTLNMQIQADISLLLLGDNTLSIIRYGIMNWDGPYFRRPLKPVMLLHRHEIDSQLSVW